MEPMENLYNDDEDCLSRIVIDVSSRSFRVYSFGGEEKVIETENMDEFLGVLQFVRDFVASGLFDEDMVVYSSPMVKS